MQRIRIANLTESQLEQVHALEEDLDTWVVAVEPAFRFAKLSDEQIAKLQQIEEQLGVILLAYERTT